MKKSLCFLIGLFILFSLNCYADETKTIAAVMDLQAEEGISQSVNRTLSDYLRGQLFNTQKFTIVTRENMEQILKEQQFQLSGCTSNECVVQVGQLLGVRKMFTGSVGKVGATYVITLKLIDIESGKAEKVETEECAKCEEDALLVSIRNVTYKITGIGKGVAIQPSSVQPVSTGTATGVKETTWQTDTSAMVLIPAGEFLMGSPGGEGKNDEHPQHKVYLDAYCIDKYEVTNEQFAKFLNEWADSRLSGRGKDTDENGQRMIYKHDWGMKKIGNKWQPVSGYEKYPAINVPWNGATQYARWSGKRLPTEAEWEKACRSGSTTKYCFGDNESELGEYAWYSNNSGNKTHPVGEKKPNAWGIYDMHGNVWEWCSDWYGDNYYKSSPYKNPQGPDLGSDNVRDWVGSRVLRGGSWSDGAVLCRSAGRKWGVVGDWWGNFFGFRCAVSAGDIKK